MQLRALVLLWRRPLRELASVQLPRTGPELVGEGGLRVAGTARAGGGGGLQGGAGGNARFSWSRRGPSGCPAGEGPGVASYPSILPTRVSRPPPLSFRASQPGHCPLHLSPALCLAGRHSIWGPARLSSSLGLCFSPELSHHRPPFCAQRGADSRAAEPRQARCFWGVGRSPGAEGHLLASVRWVDLLTC